MARPGSGASGATWPSRRSRHRRQRGSSPSSGPAARRHGSSLEQARLDAIRARSDELATALDLADGFAELIRKRSRETLGEWLARGEASSDPDLRRFAEGIRRDEAAVHAAVTETWSNGPVEGHVNRLKMIKRQMYGRAGFVLLRARVLDAA